MKHLEIKLFVIAVFVLLGQASFAMLKVTRLAQTNNIDTINISALTSVNGNEYKIAIYRYHNSIKIVYSLLDSVRWKSLAGDKKYTVLKNYLWNGKPGEHNLDSMNKYVPVMEKIRQQYCVYSRDSLLLNTRTDTAYSNMLATILNASNKKLENTEISKNYMVLDGTNFTFNIKTDVVSRTVYAHSPEADSHPLLYTLLKQTMDIYRNKKNNTFLTTKRTSGY